MPGEHFGLNSIGQVAIAVTDVTRATEFYRTVLGMRFLFEYPGMAFFDCGGVRLYLTVPQGAPPSSSILYYRVADIDAAHATLGARGVTFLQAPQRVHEDDRHQLWLAFFKDSEGNTLALMEERTK